MHMSQRRSPTAPAVLLGHQPNDKMNARSSTPILLPEGHTPLHSSKSQDGPWLTFHRKLTSAHYTCSAFVPSVEWLGLLPFRQPRLLSPPRAERTQTSVIHWRVTREMVTSLPVSWVLQNPCSPIGIVTWWIIEVETILELRDRISILGISMHSVTVCWMSK